MAPPLDGQWANAVLLQSAAWLSNLYTPTHTPCLDDAGDAQKEINTKASLALKKSSRYHCEPELTVFGYGALNSLNQFL